MALRRGSETTRIPAGPSLTFTRSMRTDSTHEHTAAERKVAKERTTTARPMLNTYAAQTCRICIPEVRENHIELVNKTSVTRSADVNYNNNTALRRQRNRVDGCATRSAAESDSALQYSPNTPPLCRLLPAYDTLPSVGTKKNSASERPTTSRMYRLSGGKLFSFSERDRVSG